MSVLSLSVFDDTSCAYPVRPEPPSQPRDLDALLARVDALVAQHPPTPDRPTWIQLDGPEPSRHPALEALVAAIRERGARVRLVTADVDRLKLSGLERLRDAGLEQLDLWLLGATPDTHDPCVGRPGALAAIEAMLPDMSRFANLFTRARFLLRRDNVADVPKAVETLGTYFHVFDVCRLSVLVRDRDALRADGVPRRVALAALRTAWDTARAHRLPIKVQGFATWPDPPMPSDAETPVADDGLHTLLTEDVQVPGLHNGCWLTPPMGVEEPLARLLRAAGDDVQELGLRFAAWGIPLRDLPLEHGGLGLPAPEDHDHDLLDETLDGARHSLPAHVGVGRSARVAVIGGPVPDGILAVSSYPMLVHALRALGADAELISPYHRPFNPWAPEDPLPTEVAFPADASGRHVYRGDDVVRIAPGADRLAHAQLHERAFLDGLDLDGFDLVVCPGWAVGQHVLRHPSLSPDARVVVADMHMLAEDIDGLEHGWPSERFVIQSTFPRYCRSYWRAGIPLRQVQWRPYPVHLGHFRQGPDPVTRREVFAGGNHSRDWRTLATAVTSTGGDLADRLVIHTGDQLPEPLVNRGFATLLDFHAAIANARYVVVPLRMAPWRPAGISVFSLALAAGRPVIASSTRAAQDHLRHGLDAILVPPSDPRALARAMKRLDEDDALLARLAKGARQAGEAVSVTRWARDLLDGLPDRRVFPLRGEDGKGPYQAWGR